MPTLFTGIVHEWYRQRLRIMFGVKPICDHLYKTNHLLGTCPTCKNGLFGKPRSAYRIQQVPLDVAHYLLIKDLKDIEPLRWAKTRWPYLRTNLEFPLPVVRYHTTTTHTPSFYDPISNTVIDVLNYSDTIIKRITRVVEPAVTPHGFYYKAFKNGKLVFRSANLVEAEERSLTLITKLKRIDSGDLPWD